MEDEKRPGTEADDVEVGMSASPAAEVGEVQALPSVLQPGSMFGGPDEIIPGIYLGGFLALEQCHRLGIEYVLSLVDADSYDQIKELLGNLLEGSNDAPALTMCHIDCEDRPRANLLQHMDTSTEFMGEALSNGKKVLVHCMAGVSRSATVVAAYIIKSEGLNPEEAVALVKEKRGCAEPNSGFVRQLSAWHTMGNKVDKEHALYKDLFSETSSVKKAASLGSGLSKPVIPDPDLRELSSSTAEANPVLVPEPTHTNRPEPTQETKVGGSREQQQGGPTSKACCFIS